MLDHGYISQLFCLFHCDVYDIKTGGVLTAEQNITIASGGLHTTVSPPNVTAAFDGDNMTFMPSNVTIVLHGNVAIPPPNFTYEFNGNTMTVPPPNVTVAFDETDKTVPTYFPNEDTVITTNGEVGNGMNLTNANSTV